MYCSVDGFRTSECTSQNRLCDFRLENWLIHLVTSEFSLVSPFPLLHSVHKIRAQGIQCLSILCTDISLPPRPYILLLIMHTYACPIGLLVMPACCVCVCVVRITVVCKDRDRDKERDKKDRERDKDKKDRDKSKDKDRDREKEKEKDRDREKEKEKDRDKEKEKEKAQNGSVQAMETA